MNPPPLVRRATAVDLSDLLALYTELAEGDPARAPANSDTAASALASVLADPARHLCVGVLGGQVVGTAELILIRSLPHHGRPWGVIENVIVADTARRNGVATAMLQHLIDLAERAGTYKVQLHSGKQRTDAHVLYRRVGFDAVAEGFKRYFDDTKRAWSEPV